MLNQREFFEVLTGIDNKPDHMTSVRDTYDVVKTLGMLQQAQSKIDVFLDALDRTGQEMQSIQKQTATRIAMADLYGIAEMASMLLPIKDCLEQALTIETTDDTAFHQGIVLTLQQLVRLFDKTGLIEINPDTGTAYVPDEHVLETGGATAFATSEIDAVVQKGYRFQDRVIRPALVRLR